MAINQVVGVLLQKIKMACIVCFVPLQGVAGKKKSILYSQMKNANRHSADGSRGKLLPVFLAVFLVLLQSQFLAQFLKCVAEPEPLNHIKQVPRYNSHKKRYDDNSPEGEYI